MRNLRDAIDACLRDSIGCFLRRSRSCDLRNPDRTPLSLILFLDGHEDSMILLESLGGGTTCVVAG